MIAMFTLYRKTIIGSLLALSALRGDITGRGQLLVDNDEFALTALLDTLVPSFLESNGIDYTSTRAGWRISDTVMPRHVLEKHLVDLLLRHISGKDTSTAADTPAFSGCNASIEGYFA